MMKMRAVVELTAESYDEEQFLLNKFPGVWWELRDNKTVFYIEYPRYHEVRSAIEEWEKINGK